MNYPLEYSAYRKSPSDLIGKWVLIEDCYGNKKVARIESIGKFVFTAAGGRYRLTSGIEYVAGFILSTAILILPEQGAYYRNQQKKNQCP